MSHRVEALWHDSLSEAVVGGLRSVYTLLDSDGRNALVEAILRGPPDGTVPRARGRERDELVMLRLEALGQDALNEQPAARERLHEAIRRDPEILKRARVTHARQLPQISTRSIAWSTEPGESPSSMVESALAGRKPTVAPWSPLVGVDVSFRAEAIRVASTASNSGDLIAQILNGLTPEEYQSIDNRRLICEAISTVPTETSDACYASVAGALESCAAVAEGSEHDRLLQVWDRFLPAWLAERTRESGEARRDILSAALNSAIGRATLCLLNVLTHMELARDRGIPASIRGRLDLLISSEGSRALLACAIVSSRLYLLSWLEFAWTVERLLPLFDWVNERKAASAWQGYLWSPSIDTRLVGVLRPYLIETCSRHEVVGSQSEVLVGLLMSIALDAPDAMSRRDFAECLRSLGAVGRARAAWMLGKRLEATEPSKRGALWDERIGPWLTGSWPRGQEFKSATETDGLVWCAVLADGAFPSAAQSVQPYLVHSDDLLLALHALDEGDVPQRFPRPTVQLLSHVVAVNYQGHMADMILGIVMKCAGADPSLRSDPRFVRIKNAVEQRLP